ncbi:glycosyltransferase family 2 protein [Microbacterium sp. 77mftsu3.1]|uniref:glycosyltransferase family 2 protein n=1 Tax=Microbacterium sp. 77mftsu3.1 TaxID=1761802 RepID=UPI000374E618|nr:glycosyltransferase [Microbacterium sp. 77mftsu3.1]SDG71404.1 Glycosyl transferase family 2 [Microbacterium sp. 77mftsu3.1]
MSILILTHNAPEYVELTIRSLRKNTQNVEFEVVVVDNASDQETVNLVTRLRDEGLIDKLQLSEVNTLFAGGNNIAASMASDDATHFLLLNSDVEVRASDWLTRLLSHHKEGAVSYGVATDPLRLDGYCLLMDAHIYRAFPLDEGHQWWWSVTKQQAAILVAGYAASGFYEHEQYVHHFGGKSGSAFLSAKGMNVGRREVYGWFRGKQPHIIDRMPSVSIKSRLRTLALRALSVIGPS